MGASSLLQTQLAAPLRIAVSGNAASQAEAFAQAARGQGFITSDCLSSHALVQLVLQEEFDLAVAYIEDTGEGLALVRWFAGRRPSTALALSSPTQNGIDAQSLSAIHPGVQLWQGMSVQAQMQRLEGLSPRGGVVGRFLEIELVDYIQIANLNAANKLVRVSSREGSGYIWFERGRIVHAEYGKLEAEQAFYALVSGVSGSFCELAFEPPEKRSIAASNTHLIMEASRLKDEAKLMPAVASIHPLDATHFVPMHNLELGELMPAEVEVTDQDLLIVEDDDSSDIDALFDSHFDLPNRSAEDFVSYCKEQPGVVQARSMLFDEKLPLSGHRDELLNWVETVLPVFRCRGAMPSSVVYAREKKSHFLAVVLDFHLILIELQPQQDPYAMREDFIVKVSQL